MRMQGGAGTSALETLLWLTTGSLSLILAADRNNTWTRFLPLPWAQSIHVAKPMHESSPAAATDRRRERARLHRHSLAQVDAAAPLSLLVATVSPKVQGSGNWLPITSGRPQDRPTASETDTQAAPTR